MTKILVIAEHDQANLKLATHHAITAAQELQGEIDVLVIESGCQSVADDAARLPYVKQVFLVDHHEYAHQLAENVSAVIAEVAGQYEYLIATATTFGKNILPRVAALLDVNMIGDVVKIISANSFVRPIYAGNALATVESSEAIKLLTVRGTAFKAVKLDEEMHATITPLQLVITNTLSHFVSQSLTQSTRPDLTAARIVISGGRGLKSAENFQMLESIADKLGAAIGASRAAVDAGFAPNDYQVGQTGKVIAPDLYIAIGISGAIQHLAGMKDSKVIVAINNDPEAPIFQVADYGVVGDLFKLLPELENELEKVL